MGLRHVYGQIELLQRGFDSFNLVALCDLSESAAGHVAAEAEKGLGRRPGVYTSFDEMLVKEKELDAVDIVTETGLHHILALKAFEAGKAVAVEKPLGLTVRACRRMIDASARAGAVLSVFENYRRDPMIRLVKAVLDEKAIGDTRLVIDLIASGDHHVPHATAWRVDKARGGYLLDQGAHHADLLIHFMGEVDRVYAETRLWEKVRYISERPASDRTAKFYGHRQKEQIELADTIAATAEDMAMAVIRFKSGATGQIGMTIAAPGQATRSQIIYCSEGSLTPPTPRSGQPVQVTMAGQRQPLADKDVLELAPRWTLDDTTAAFFDGSRRLFSYDMPFDEIDRKLIAIELQDFADAIVNGREPTVTGPAGLQAVALTHAILESGHLGEPVSFADVVEDRVNAYQQDINDGLAL
jgi:predicted dehydrogenase